MIRCLNILLILLLLLTSNTTFAQQQDAVGTLAIQVEKKINRTYSLAFYNQYGFNENYTELGYALYDLGANIKLNANFLFGLNYRIASIKADENTYFERNYYYADLSWNKSYGNFSINARSRYLIKRYGWQSNEDLNYKPNNHYLRNKIQLKYELNYTYAIFTSFEQVYRLDLSDETEQIRLTGGVNYQFDNKNRLQLAYTVLQEINKKAPDTKYITGLTYYYKF